jgi:hypothetical protein
MERHTELLVRLDERVDAMVTDITDVKVRLKNIETVVAEDKNKRVGMYTILVSVGAVVSWFVGNLYAVKNWLIP